MCKMDQRALYNYALRLLTRRDYPHAELKKKLEQKVAETVESVETVAFKEASRALSAVDQVLETLTQQSLLSDSRYVESFIRAKRSRGHGPYRILLALKNKGVDPDRIAEHLDAQDPVWAELAAEQLIRKFKPKQGGAHTIRWQERAKMSRYLAQKGYGSGQISEAFSRFQAVQESVQYDPYNS